mmetsp:Transcript_14895/g.56493  ORF Transcript_14895/g.56493 Transcript_14895/m.56493 type:complete len:236 (+) Transcript_14895:2593-3300(+)
MTQHFRNLVRDERYPECLEGPGELLRIEVAVLVGVPLVEHVKEALFRVVKVRSDGVPNLPAQAIDASQNGVVCVGEDARTWGILPGGTIPATAREGRLEESSPRRLGCFPKRAQHGNDLSVCKPEGIVVESHGRTLGNKLGCVCKRLRRRRKPFTVDGTQRNLGQVVHVLEERFSPQQLASKRFRLSQGDDHAVGRPGIWHPRVGARCPYENHLHIRKPSRQVSAMNLRRVPLRQ